MKKQRYWNNIYALYVYSIFVKRPVVAILTVYYLANQLSLAQIGYIAAAMSVATIVFEVPGGMFADAAGRVKSLLIGAILTGVTMLLLVFGQSFIPFLLAGIFYGIANSFLSGTRQALMYDSLLALKKKDQYKDYYGKMVSYAYFVNAFILLTIPFLYERLPKFPFWLNLIFCGFMVIACFFMKEPPVSKQDKNVAPLLYSKFTDSVKHIRLNPQLLFIVLIKAIVLSIVYVNGSFLQAIFLESGILVSWFGFVYLFARLVKSFGSRITSKAVEIFSDQKLFIASLIMVCMGFYIFSFQAIWSIILAMILVLIGESFVIVLASDEINQQTKSKNRATVLSLANLIQQAVGAAAGIGIGYLASIAGIATMYSYLAIGLAIALVLVHIAFIGKRRTLHDAK